MKTDKEQDLIKKIAYHEAYSTAYKIQLAKNVAVRSISAGGKTLYHGGKKLIRFMKPFQSMGIKGLEWIAFEPQYEMRVKALNKQTLERRRLWDNDAQLFFDTLVPLNEFEGILARFKGKIVGSAFIKVIESSDSLEILYPCVADSWKTLGIEEAMLLEILKRGVHYNILKFKIIPSKLAIEENVLFDKLGFKKEETEGTTVFIKEVNKT